MKKASFKLAVYVLILFSYQLCISNFYPLMNNLVYSSYLYRNNNSITQTWDLLLDSKGNPVILGVSNEPGLPFTKGAYKTKIDSVNKSRAYNGYLLKQNKDSYQIEHLTSLGISNYRFLNAVMALDKDDNVYVALLQDTINTIVADVDYNTHKSILLLKLNSDFSKVLASTYFGNDLTQNKSTIYLYDMKIDKKGNIIITGTCDSNGIKTTPDCFQPNNLKAYKTAFVAKFTSDFQELLFSTYITGTYTTHDILQKAFSEVRAIGIGVDNEIILAGSTNFKDFPFDNEKIDISNGAIQDNTIYTKGFITIIDESGQIRMKSIYNVKSINSNNCGNNDMVIANNGNIYVIGVIDNTSLWTDIGKGYQSNYLQEWFNASFIQCYSPSLLLLNSTYFSNDKCHSYAEHLCVSKSNEIYVSGSFLSIGNSVNDIYNPPITTKGAYPFNILPTNSYAQEHGIPRTGTFISIFNSDLNQLKYSTTFGGSDATSFWNMVIDSNDKLYLTGYAAGAIYFPITENALWKTYYPYNQFLAKFSNLKDQVSVDGFKIAPSNIFPNPATDYLNISFDSPKEGLGTIEIIDLLGIKVCSFENYITSGNNSIKYSELDNLQTATYTVKVTINNEIVSIGKFIKR